jgi:hypothetical protein
MRLIGEYVLGNSYIYKKKNQTKLANLRGRKVGSLGILEKKCANWKRKRIF